MKGIRKVIIFLTALVLVVEPVWATTISDLQKEQEEIKKQQEEMKRKQQEEQNKLGAMAGQISGLEGQVGSLADELDELDAGLVEILASVELIQDDISKTEEQIEITQEAYEEAQRVEGEQYEAMKKRIKYMYEKGDLTYLEIFFESSSFSDMLNKVEYIEKLYEYDRNMLEEYQITRAETAALKERLEEEMAQLEATMHELEEEQGILEEMLNEKQKEYDNYEVKLAQARQQAAIYKANIKKQTDQIRKLEAEEAKKREALDKARREEEERKAAENAASGQEGDSSGDRDSQEGSDSSSGDEGSSGKDGGYAPPGSSGGGKGDQIASYACQFVGNPYVAGGTSLTQGADCSGFVWRVFKDFGYSVSRTSYSIRSNGTGVSYSDARPGDIICYAGHVGIYIGNGNIVHASTAKTGIKITHATYKEILSVRRIV